MSYTPIPVTTIAAGPAAATGATASVTEDPTSNKLLDKAKEIRAALPQWETFGHVASKETLVFVATFASMPAERKKMLEAGNLEPIVALIALFDKLSNLSTVQYVATLLNDVLEDEPAKTGLVIKAGQSMGQPTTEVFVKKLSRSDDAYLGMVAASVVARLLRADAEIEPATLRAYYSWLQAELKSDDKNRVLPALACLARVFRRPRFRMEFCRDPAQFEALAQLVKVEAPIQQQYQAILCCWTLAFSSAAISLMGGTGMNLVTTVADVLSAAKKEKNMVENCEEQAKRAEMCVLMVSHRLLSVVQAIATQSTFNDVELKEDAEAVATKLREAFENMSTFDEYVAELRSGKLDWSPVHRSDRFWRENAIKLNDKKHELLKLLVAYLKKAEDKTSVAVAVHDCGEYVTHYPYGRQALRELGAKAMIMEMMNHEDSTIRYEALIAVQKMMTDNWEYLGKKAKQEAEEKKG